MQDLLLKDDASEAGGRDGQRGGSGLGAREPSPEARAGSSGHREAHAC